MGNRRNRKIAAFFLSTLFIFTVACGDDDDGMLTGPDMGNGASLRVVHASPDAPAVDVWVEGGSSPLVTNLAYGQASGYVEVDPGVYNIQIRAAGSSASSAPAFETGDLTIPEEAVITAVAAGLLGGAAGSGEAFRVLPLVETFDNPGAGNVAVRIVHASADAPAVAVDVGGDGTPEIPSLERYADTGGSGVALPANTALAIALWAGNPLSKVTSFTTPQLPEGGELFVIATGLLASGASADDSFSLLAVGPSGAIGFIRQNPVLFALHGSPDAPAVDINVGGTGAVLAAGLSFGDLSGPIQVAPGSYDLDFRVSPGGAVASTVTTPTLAAGERYLAVASGFVGDGSFTLIPLGDDFTEGAGGALVKVVHASPDAPTVDVGTVSGGAVSPIGDFTALSFAEASPAGGTSVPVAPLTLGVAVTGTTAPVATFDVTTASGLKAFAVALGSIGGNGESFRLLIVDTAVDPWTAAEILPN